MPPAYRGVRRRKRVCFRYAKETWQGKLRARPRIEAVLRSWTKQMRTLLLIDSGADISFLPAAVADILGLELSEEKHRSRGVSGWFETRTGKCDITLRSTGGTIELKDVPVLVPVEDPKDAGDTVMDYCLLGRSPLFDLYHVTFKQHEGRIILTRARRG